MAINTKAIDLPMPGTEAPTGAGAGAGKKGKRLLGRKDKSAKGGGRSADEPAAEPELGNDRGGSRAYPGPSGPPLPCHAAVGSYVIAVSGGWVGMCHTRHLDRSQA